MVTTQIQIENNQMEWLKEQAQNKGVSVSQIVCESIDFFRVYKEKQSDIKKKRALAAIGRFASESSDVSLRHDNYLVDAYTEGKLNEK